MVELKCRPHYNLLMTLSPVKITQQLQGLHNKVLNLWLRTIWFLMTFSPALSTWQHCYNSWRFNLPAFKTLFLQHDILESSLNCFSRAWIVIKILNFTNSQQSLMSVDLMSNSLPFNFASKLMQFLNGKISIWWKAQYVLLMHMIPLERNYTLNRVVCPSNNLAQTFVMH